MNLRYIVPALGLAALTSTSFAEDKAPAVTFSGWADNILTIATNDLDDDTTTGPDESGVSAKFSAVGSIKANWKVTDALTAKINLWFSPGTDGLNLRESYFTWAFNDSVSWGMGKYIDHIGWLSAEPTGLYTINASLIGYTSTYGNDVLGTFLSVAPKDSPVSGSLHITNGYYTGGDANNGYQSPNRENSDLGFGLDLTYAFPKDMGNINLEFAYDMHSEFNPGSAGAGMGGDVFLVGVNATVKPIKPLMIGAEFQYLSIGEGETVTGASVPDSDSSRMQGLLLANWAIEGAKIPMSVSGMVQYVTVSSGNSALDDEKRLEVAGALLTNPLGSSNFGLNFEVGYFDLKDQLDGSVDNKGVVISVEGLVTF